MKRLSVKTIFLFSLVPFALLAAGCMAIGDLYGTQGDSLWVTPIRSVYNVYEDVWTVDDFEVYSSHKGTILHIPKDLLFEKQLSGEDEVERIQLWVDSDLATSPLIPEVDDEHLYIFESAGTYKVVIHFLHMTTYYKIQVLDLKGIGKEENPTGGTGGGIIIEWARPDREQHNWSEWVVTTPPTDDEDGEETRTCTSDAHAGHTETRSIPATKP